MPHRDRLSTREFSEVFDCGQRIGHKWFTLRVLSCDGAPDAGVRWGFAVGKRLAPSSVGRNRVRRRLRAAIAGIVVPGGAWIVVQMRAEGLGASVQELQSAIIRRLATVGAKE